MSEFTEFDFRTPEQKIAANNARIQELKNRKAQLEAKRNQMKVTSNRARLGDASFVHTMFANEADQANARRKQAEEMQDLLNSYDAQLEALDNELSKPGDEPTKRGYRIKKAEIAKKRERLLAKFPDLETTYVDVGEGQQAATDDLMEAIYNSVADDLTEQKRADLVNMVEEYERKNGVTTKTTALKKKIKKTATDTEKETERANANKAIDKALEDVDYVSLQKKGSYTRSVKVNGKLYTVEIKDGVASCNGVKREW
jgi:hypothetical protein